MGIYKLAHPVLSLSYQIIRRDDSCGLMVGLSHCMVEARWDVGRLEK